MSEFIELMTCDRRKIISKLVVFLFEGSKLFPEPYHAYYRLQYYGYILLSPHQDAHTVLIAHSACKCRQAPRSLLLFQ